MNQRTEGPVIHLSNVTKTYYAGEYAVHAVRGVSLVVQRGELVAVMGASGSGKSTLMNILGCLDRPTSGQYLLNSASIGELDRSALATLRNRQLGFVFQSFNLLARTTALENVELPMFYSHPLVARRLQRKRAIDALEKVGLGGRLTHRPNQLSGGQQQRLAIARALVNEPDLVLADEPTGNLDSRTSIEIMGLFQDLNDDGITIVMVTHDLEISAYCRRIVVMRDGSILTDELNQNRRLAGVELAALHRAQSAASIA
jgi:putative ABC transport system ATP-binding protein